MTEKQVEQLLKRRIEKEIPGARCMKWVCPGHNGVPDRIILLPGGRAVFVETKRPGEHPRQTQLFMHERLRRMGFAVAGCVDSPSAVDVAVEICKVAMAAGRLHESGSGGEDPREEGGDDQ